jgi:hypothetical protein
MGSMGGCETHPDETRFWFKLNNWHGLLNLDGCKPSLLSSIGRHRLHIFNCVGECSVNKKAEEVRKVQSQTQAAKIF